MACPSLHTGERFLATALAHIDCQSQVIGSYGFQALASPGSPVSVALTSLLTIFIALFGTRLLLGYPMDTRDLVGDALKLGIVLTLATSWPAWRTLGYDLIVFGPSEIARSIGLAAALPGSDGSLADRLQSADSAISALNGLGSGRLGVAQGDWFQLGLARSVFLVGTLAPLALVRIMAGILLAIAPLVAALLLFGITRSVFAGWAKALAMVYMASIALALILGVELAVLEPWLGDALAQRMAERQTLDAPIEVLVVTLTFAIVALGSLALISRLAFAQSVPILSGILPTRDAAVATSSHSTLHSASTHDSASSRAERVSLAVSDSLRRETRRLDVQGAERTSQTRADSASSDRAERLGESFRRGNRRVSGLSQRRDGAQ